MSTTLEVSFSIGEKSVDSVVVKDLTFTQFVNVAHAAQIMTQPATIEGRLMRARIMQQVDYFKDKQPVKFTIEELLKMPFPVARKLQSSFDTTDVRRGKVIGEGDGVTNAVRYELGAPIAFAEGKEPIRELEFLATTYGEVEDVISGTDPLDQTIALIKGVAKPVHDTLQSLPSWAVEKVSIADGLAIAEAVLPRFLEGS